MNHSKFVSGVRFAFIGIYLFSCWQTRCLTGADLYYPLNSENFIIRWAFQDLCDHVFDPRGSPFWPSSLEEGGVTFNPQDVKSGDIIFVRNIDLFMKQVHPHIKQPYFMVTHGEHLETVWDHHLKYLESKKIIGWASIHPPKKGPEKFFPIPLGVQQYPRYYHNKKEFTALLSSIRAIEKTKLLYLNIKIEYNKLERERVVELLSDKPFTTYRKEPCSFDCYMNEMAQHKFVVSPRGLGPDCYRTWEALLIGTIPIVRRNQGDPKASLNQEPSGSYSLLDSLYEGLPVLIIDAWEDITEELLNRKYEEITAKKYDPRKLYMEYWRTKIMDERDTFFHKR